MIRNIPIIFRRNLIKNPNAKVLGVKKNNSWEWTNRNKLNNNYCLHFCASYLSLSKILELKLL